MGKIEMKELMKEACDYYHCSDGHDHQYPDCDILEGHTRVRCPAKDMLNILENLAIEIITRQSK